MRKEFVMRGQTESGKTEVLNFSGFKSGMAYKLISFDLYPSTSVGATNVESIGSITAGKTAIAPADPDFNDDALIATSYFVDNASSAVPVSAYSVVNDTFLITQNLILMVQDASGGSSPVNWQCRFKSVKMNASEETVNNYKQFMISDGS
tara:strand:- start:1076 stop:1525 length:450 start_codon:yes stop_codon:yes gene_type:complete